jgi:hypothetical protein
MPPLFYSSKSSVFVEKFFFGFVLGKLGTNHHQLLELGMKAIAAALWIKTHKIVQKMSSSRQW